MIHVLRGRIGANEKIRTVETGLGSREVINSTIYVWDGRENSKSIPVRVEAWGENAKKFAKYKKGQTITIVGKLQSIEVKHRGESKARPEIGYRILMIDDEGKFLNMVNDLFALMMKFENEKNETP